MSRPLLKFSGGSVTTFSTDSRIPIHEPSVKRVPPPERDIQPHHPRVRPGRSEAPLGHDYDGLFGVPQSGRTRFSLPAQESQEYIGLLIFPEPCRCSPAVLRRFAAALTEARNPLSAPLLGHLTSTEGAEQHQRAIEKVTLFLWLGTLSLEDQGQS